MRGIHRALTGIDESTGERFRIDDEENLLWVHCAEIYPYLRVARLSGMPVTDAQADTYVAEQRRSAELVGLDPRKVPGSAAELDDYFERMCPSLRLTASARRGIRMWINTPAPPRLIALKLAYPYLGGLGVALLPGWARELYGVPGNGPAGRALETTATALARLTRQALLALPDRYTGTKEQMRRVHHAQRLMNAA